MTDTYLVPILCLLVVLFCPLPRQLYTFFKTSITFKFFSVKQSCDTALGSKFSPSHIEVYVRTLRSSKRATSTPHANPASAVGHRKRLSIHLEVTEDKGNCSPPSQLFVTQLESSKWLKELRKKELTGKLYTKKQPWVLVLVLRICLPSLALAWYPNEVFWKVYFCWSAWDPYLGFGVVQKYINRLCHRLDRALAYFVRLWSASLSKKSITRQRMFDSRSTCAEQYLDIYHAVSTSWGWFRNNQLCIQA